MIQITLIQMDMWSPILLKALLALAVGLPALFVAAAILGVLFLFTIEDVEV